MRFNFIIHTIHTIITLTQLSFPFLDVNFTVDKLNYSQRLRSRTPCHRRAPGPWHCMACQWPKLPKLPPNVTVVS